MHYENKKAARSAARRFESETTEALLARWAGPMTRSEATAVERVLRARQTPIPAEHGPISDDEAATNVIRIEDLADMPVQKETQNAGMGFVEGISVAVGVLLTVMLWRSQAWLALFYGFAVSLALYAGLGYLRRFWKEMGRE